MLVFVHIEKTAGTSLKFIFRNTFGKGQVDTLKNKKAIFSQDDLNFAKKIFGNVECLAGHNLVEPTKNLNDKDLHIFTFLRDPLTRTASHYQDQCLRNGLKMDFETWIQNKDMRNLQVKRIAGNDDLEKAKRLLNEQYFFIGLTERFDESLKLFKITSPEKLNLKFKKMNIAQDNSIKKEILNNPTKLKLLTEANELDIQLYEYVKNELYPKRIKEHQEELKNTSLPTTYYKSHYTWNYQLNVFFNKFIYRQILKIRAKLQ
ncbi:sulfotransferase family 2 domain-containing protein [Sediminitomix flava]|uniref:Sulfotransferase family protein n=1 Tax=Sediminitomix flava TaxID=379075 RepID=A0A315Z7J8_SEDFL|nr:sulfotransferase family 2 domain-containing protein [Sediminitomix flava]PWJ39180.1 sulfotransferase family protein [Sediminitomix flava]